MSSFVYLFHVLFVGLLFIFVGIYRENIPKWMFPVLFSLGIVVVLYHLYHIVHKWSLQKSYWVNLLHVFIMGPLLIMIGYFGEKTSRLYFELLLMLGFAAVGYHTYYFIRNLIE